MSTANERSVRLGWIASQFGRRPARPPRQAQEWLVIQQSHQGLPAALQHEWDTWAADPRNLAEFREYEKVDTLLRALPRQPLPTDAELRAHFLASPPDLSDFHRRDPSPRPGFVIALAAVIAVLLVSGLLSTFLLRPVQPQSYQTSRGQQLTVTLKDHSVIKLGGATRLSVLLTNGARRVTLYEGEAMLSVARNPHVPFQVDVETTRVTALGTAFHVRRYINRQVSVEVAEGAVAVSPQDHEVHNILTNQSSDPLQSVTVRAGQEVNADATGHLGPAHPADFQAIAWWLYGRRVYREKPLGKVIEDLQLYFPRHIEYNHALESLPFNGIIDPSKPEESIRGLEEVFPIQVDDSDPHRIIIRCRKVDCR